MLFIGQSEAILGLSWFRPHSCQGCSLTELQGALPGLVPEKFSLVNGACSQTGYLPPADCWAAVKPVCGLSLPGTGITLGWCCLLLRLLAYCHVCGAALGNQEAKLERIHLQKNAGMGTLLPSKLESVHGELVSAALCVTKLGVREGKWHLLVFMFFWKSS